MEESLLYARLMELAGEVGVEVRTAPVEPPGGVCRLKGKVLVLLSRETTLSEKIDLLASALAELPELEGRYLLPAVRECLERHRRGEEKEGPAPG